MATVGVVKAIVTADISQLKKGMNDAQRSMDRMGKQMSKVGKSMTMKVTMPLAGIGLAAAKMASDFEFSMTQIETLVGRSAEEVETLKGAVLGLSGETGRAPKELADAMFFITSAGLDAASATAALEMSAKAAAVGLGDTSVVADAVTNAMNGYGMAADGAAFATDVLAKTVEQGKASAADLAPQFGRLIPMAAELGISFDQVGAGLAFLTRSSGDAAMSSTMLGGIMKSLIKPSSMAKKTLDEIGFSLQDFRQAASEDLLTALQVLRRTLEENGKEFGDVIEDARALGGALQLTGVSTDQAREVFDELANSAGKLDEAFRGVQKTAQFKMSQAMAGMKASMITLGEQILPVVVPMIQQLAEWISRVAEAFGALSGPVQKSIVVFGILLAAAGPVLMIIGSMSTGLAALAGAFGLAAGGMAAMLPPLALMIAAVGAAMYLWQKFSDDTRSAEETLADLRTEMIESGDASLILLTDLDELTTRIKNLGTATDTTTGNVGSFLGKVTLLQELINRDVRKTVQDLGLDMDNLNRVALEAADAQGNLQHWFASSDTAISRQVELVNQHRDALGEDTDKIIEALENGTLYGDQLVAIAMALQVTAQGHKDLAAEVQAEAEEYFADGKAVTAYEANLSAANVTVIDAMLAEGRHAEALEYVIRQTGYAETAAQQLAEAIAREATVAAAAATADDGLSEAAIRAAEANAELRARVLEMNAAIEAGLAPLGQTVYELERAAVAAADADRALFAFIESNSAAAQNRTHWGEVAARQARAQADADEQRRKRLSSELGLVNGMAKVAKHNLELAEEAAEVAERDAKVKEDALKALKAQAKVLAGQLRTAQADVTAAVEDMAAAQRDVARATADIADIDEHILDLLGEQVVLAAERLLIDEDIKRMGEDILALEAKKGDYLARNVDLGRAFEHEMDKALLTVIDLQKKVDDLTATQVATVDTTTAQGAVTALETQRAAVNDVEQALIDMNVIAAEDAGLTDLTIKEARALQRLEGQLRRVEQEYEDGEADVLQLMAATQDWDSAMADARLGSDKLRAAQEALSAANAASIELKKEQENIDLKLKVATEDLRLAQVAANEETQRKILIDEHDAKITDQITKLKEEQTSATEQQTRIDERLLEITDLLAAAKVDSAAATDAVTAAQDRYTEAVEEHRYAQVRLKSVQEELNTVQSTQNDLWRELVDLINDAGGAFRDLKKDIENVKDADKSATGGGGAASGGGAGGGGVGTGGPVSGTAHGWTPETEYLMNVMQKGGLDLWKDISANVSTDASNVEARFNYLNESLQAGRTPEDISAFLATLAPSAATGGFVKSAGLVNVHAGETITPGGGGATYITVNIEGSVASERDLVESIRKGLLRSQQSGRAVVL